jgi:RNA recognition motif-containing protein
VPSSAVCFFECVCVLCRVVVDSVGFVCVLRFPAHTDKPKENPRATLDAMRTLFVGRLHFGTTEEKLLSEYSEFGPISQVWLPCCGQFPFPCTSCPGLLMTGGTGAWGPSAPPTPVFTRCNCLCCVHRSCWCGMRRASLEATVLSSSRWRRT